ncbi:acyl-CoA synthetase [Mycobacterium vicinigordonae]|uniref:Acyl-CoA synthetase n=1 Tax=Mycobacterium vicinigordonae TaxID=1719132 RepID=A0A7D6I0U0_9MYCO|nr:acyl-CoA synthetase [Mycobacterium vicinigordonae]QLL07394.1 acyl-CoA synthetase [Mycobacterium vicinigordonae]
MINIADAFERVVDRIPDREAVVCGERRLSYRALDDRATQLAHWLAEHGVGHGDDVAIYCRNGPEYLEAMLAAFKIRAVPINVNYRYQKAELTYLFRDSDPKSVIAAAEFAADARTAAPRAAVLTVGIEYEAALARQSSARDFAPRSPDDEYILYTGGTTGYPKGVIWRHEDIFFAALGGPRLADVTDAEEVGRRAERGGQARFLLLSPLMHGAAHWGAFNALFGGHTIVLDDQQGFDAERALRLSASEGITAIGLVGDAFARPLGEALVTFTGDLPKLQTVLSGGALLSETVKEQLVRRLPGLTILDGYGSSETGAQGHAIGDASGGRPRFVIGSDTLVIDDYQRAVAPGSGRVGKLARRGHVPLGYRGDPDRTARTFPVIDGVRWAITGDDAVVELDGSIALLGRGSSCINTGGEKVYPDEIEAALKKHPDVADAIVVGIPHPRWGQQVAAVLEARPDTAVAADDIRAHVRAHLADYKVPRTIVFVPSVSRSPAGKADLLWARRVVETATQ